MSRVGLQTKAASCKPLAQKQQTTLTPAHSKRFRPNPHVSSPLDTLHLNQAIGNRAATRHLNASSGVRVQPKLAVGHIDDPYERQADQVAAGRQPSNLQPTTQATGMPVSAGFAKQLSHTKGGSSLPAKTRLQMEANLGADLSDVRVHTDSQAGRLNQQLQSHAFTHGRDIYFNRGRYQPGTTTGDQLLAHELTHVAQQDGATPMLQAGRRSNEELAQEIIDLCEKNDKLDLAPNLIEVVNLCLTTFEDNTEIEDQIFDYLLMILPTGLMPKNASKHRILDVLASRFSDLTAVQLSAEESDETDSSSDDAEQYDSVPIAERPVIKLYMEQGVAAPLGQAILFSGQFSTCSPVIMLNNSTGMGGLFHFAAKGLHKQSGDLLNLCDLVDPDVIYLMEGDRGTHVDTDALWKFFDDNRPEVELKELNISVSGLYITFNEKNSLQLTTRSPKNKPVTHNLRKADTVELPPNIQFVGKSEVADHWL